MSQQLQVYSQGIEKNSFQASGDHDEQEWGCMSPDQLLEFMQKVEKMPEPDYSTGEDICPPVVYVDNPEINLGRSNLSFALNCGKLLYMDIDNEHECEVTPFEAVSLSTGQKSGADLVAEKKGAAPTPPAAKPQQAIPRPQAQEITVKKRGPVRTIALVIGIIIIVLGGLAILGGEPGGGMIFIVVGAIPTFWGWSKKTTGSRSWAEDDALHHQNLALTMDNDHDDDAGDVDIDFD